VNSATYHRAINLHRAISAVAFEHTVTSSGILFKPVSKMVVSLSLRLPIFIFWCTMRPLLLVGHTTVASTSTTKHHHSLLNPHNRAALDTAAALKENEKLAKWENSPYNKQAHEKLAAEG
jgi:hypothetical protein